MLHTVAAAFQVSRVGSEFDQTNEAEVVAAPVT
jgi:hypothetical protein